MENVVFVVSMFFAGSSALHIHVYFLGFNLVGATLYNMEIDRMVWMRSICIYDIGYHSNVPAHQPI